MVEEQEQDVLETGTSPVEPITDNDEYAELDFKSCFIKKNVSVLKWLYDEFGFIVGVAIGIVFFVALLIIALSYIAESIIHIITTVISYVVSINPVVDIIIGGLLIIPAYSFFWCINHRRKKRLEKQMLDKMECRLGDKV